jgi:hypothetical protein
MRRLRTIVLFDQGAIQATPDWIGIHQSIDNSIRSVDHPAGAGTLTLRRKHRRPDGQWERNGVLYLKRRFIENMVQAEGWRDEVDVQLAPAQVQPILQLFPGGLPYQEPITSSFGEFDLLTDAPNGTRCAIEWETGNISSSHRSMNKLAICLGAGAIQAGVLIVPSRACYEHLTDRIGNIGELSGYLDMWHRLAAGVAQGVLAIVVVEHDNLTDDLATPYLPVGNDGRAAQGRANRR